MNWTNETKIWCVCDITICLPKFFLQTIDNWVIDGGHNIINEDALISLPCMCSKPASWFAPPSLPIHSFMGSHDHEFDIGSIACACICVLHRYGAEVTHIISLAWQIQSWSICHYRWQMFLCRKLLLTISIVLAGVIDGGHNIWTVRTPWLGSWLPGVQWCRWWEEILLDHSTKNVELKALTQKLALYWCIYNSTLKIYNCYSLIIILRSNKQNKIIRGVKK